MVITEAELDAALMRELCSGRQLREVMENKEELAAAMHAQSMRGHKTLKSLGRQVAEIPEKTFWEIGKHVGMEFWQDRNEVRKFLEKNPHLKVSNI